MDDLQQPLSEVVAAGLIAADEVGFSSIALPTIRMGVMLGVVENTVEEALDEMLLGVQKFLDSKPECVESITFVVYDDSETEKKLRDKMASAA
ncbi:MAG: hypothetical protein NTW79_01665 [Candidatus Berkelbacteria bacterium]|nr:hypothetical protein [Candidatus Berkelbacteria bacterium]